MRNDMEAQVDQMVIGGAAAQLQRSTVEPN